MHKAIFNFMKNTLLLLTIGFFCGLPLGVNAAINPSSVVCSNMGGMDFMSPDEEFHLCKFSDGSECEVWDMVAEECKKGQYRDWIAEYPKAPDIYVADIWSESRLEQDVWPVHKESAQEGRVLVRVYGDEGSYYLAGLTVGNANRMYGPSPETIVELYKNGELLDTFDVRPLESRDSIEDIYLYISIDPDDQIVFSVNADRAFEEVTFDNNEFVVTLDELQERSSAYSSESTKSHWEYLKYLISFVVVSGVIGVFLAMRKRSSRKLDN